jgi:hypothetical protein
MVKDNYLKEAFAIVFLVMMVVVALLAFQLKAQGSEFCYAETSCGEEMISCQVNGPDCTAERGDDWVQCFGTTNGKLGTVRVECPGE